MKKITSIVLAMLLCIGLLTGCGQSYETDKSTVFVKKDGKIVSTDVEAFDTNTYDEEGLKTYIENAVSAYTDANGKDSVVMKDLTVKDGNAMLILEYAGASDYAGFNGIELYTGSVSEALSAGYSFDVDFASVADGTIESCQVKDFLGSDYKVVIIKGNTTVNVAGKIAYVSTANTTYVDSSTITIQEGTSLFGQSTLDTESTEAAQETVDGTEVGTEEEFSEAVSDDDDALLIAAGEESGVVFEFDEDEVSDDSQTSEFSQIYTYIIYK